MGNKSSKRSSKPIGSANKLYEIAAGTGASPQRSVPTDITFLIDSDSLRITAIANTYSLGGSTVTTIPSAAIVKKGDGGKIHLVYGGIITAETFAGNPSTNGRILYIVANVVNDLVQVLGVDMVTNTIVFATRAGLYNSTVPQTVSYDVGIQVPSQNDQLIATGVSAITANSSTGEVLASLPQIANIQLVGTPFTKLDGTPVTLSMIVSAVAITLQQLSDGSVANAVTIPIPTTTEKLYKVGDVWDRERDAVSPQAAAIVEVQ